MKWGKLGQRLIARSAGFFRASADASAVRKAERGGQQPQDQSPGQTQVSAQTRARTEDTDSLVGQMLAQGRCALLLRPQIIHTLGTRQRVRAQSTFAEATSFVPNGEVVIQPWRSEALEANLDCPVTGRRVCVEPMFLDRFPITNGQFREFVKHGGYLQESLWHQGAWPRVTDMVDRTGHAGPRYWSDGRFPKGCADHPVVGVCWFEADAFARWAGKRLPTDAEWLKAACWPLAAPECEPVQRKYPWGETLDAARANLWASGLGTTSRVTDFPEGCSVGGVSQLIGNVWEWMANSFTVWTGEDRVELDRSLMSLRGGAFDTYFESHVTCQFQSGDSALARKHNIGFRCAISGCDVSVDKQTSDSVATSVPARGLEAPP